MADAAVEFLLVNLKHLLVYNVNLISSVKDQVNYLCDDIRLLAVLIKRTTDSPNKDAVVKEVVRQIRIEVYKAEDIIDRYVLHASVHKSRTNILERFLHAPNYSMKLRSVAKEIEEIRGRVKEIYSNKLVTKTVLSKTETFIKRPRSVEEKNVVGFDEEAAKLVGWLKAETKELEVISVVGMGGLGKTTLVKKVFDDPSIQRGFSICSWADVSHVCNTREVFHRILNDVTRKSKDKSERSVIADELRKSTSDRSVIADELRSKLKGVKYLIVLDDVWTKEAWDELTTGFPDDKNGSRILITSRNKDVAVYANTSLPPYQLRFLTEDESWKLLEKKVFPRETCCSGDLETIGKEIAKKCCGLPLMIVVIAGILKKDQHMTPRSWEEIKQNVNTRKELEQCMEVLALSYHQLPHNLKACFLYFGIFPKHVEIPVWKLIHIWVAEGFIQPTGIENKSAEEMAEEYLLDLVDQNLVVVVEYRRANGGIKTCRIHDMLHDMCVKQAEEENFFKQFKGSEQSINQSNNPNVLRRVSVHSQVSDYVSSEPDSSHVRSLLCYGLEQDVLRCDLKRFLSSFKLLRVLDVLPISFTRFPTIILVHLRYIALLGTFEVLPAAVSSLRNLQTLIVETKSDKIKVKVDLCKLLQLRHFYTSAASDLPTPSSHSRKGGKDPLVNKNLRTMSKVSPNSCTDVILAQTPNLQKLGVRGNLALLLEEKKGICKFDNIAKLKHLKKLKLLNDTHPITPLDGGLPDWYKFPEKLEKLTLSNTMLDWGQMSVLGALPMLEVLKLVDNAFVGERWVTLENSFVKLRVLQIGKTNLVHWETKGRQFRQLERVSLKHCEQLDAIPSSLGDIQSLQVMELTGTSRSAIDSARKIQKYFKLDVFPGQKTQT